MSWLMVENIIKIGVGAVLSIWIARKLGPTRFGLYSYAIVYASIFYAFVGLGLRKIVVRELSKNKEGAKKIIGTSFFMILSAAIVMSILTPLSLFLFSDASKITVLLVAIMSSGFIFQSFQPIAFYYESQTRMKWVMILSLFGFAIGTLIKIFALLQDSWIHWLVIGSMLELALASLFLYFIFPKELKPIRQISFDLTLAKKLLKESYPLIVIALAIKLYTDIDQIMLKNMYDLTETGRYAIAVKFSKICTFLPSAIFISVFPNLVKTKSNNEAQYKNKLQKLYNVCSFLGYGFAIFFTFFGNLIISILLGPEYASSAFFLKILIWSNLFIFLGGARTLFLISENLTQLYMFTIIIGCALNIGLNYIFIPIYGGVAACIVTLITTFIAGIGINFFIPKLFETGLMQMKSLVYPKFW